MRNTKQLASQESGHQRALPTTMNFKLAPLTNMALTGLVLLATMAMPPSAAGQVQPDNSKTNQHDKNPGEVTADSRR
jgi:hypothetical protein